MVLTLKKLNFFFDIIICIVCLLGPLLTNLHKLLDEGNSSLFMEYSVKSNFVFKLVENVNNPNHCGKHVVLYI